MYEFPVKRLPQVHLNELDVRDLARTLFSIHFKGTAVLKILPPRCRSPSQWLGRLVSKTKLLAPKSLRARRNLNSNSNQAAALTSDIDPSSSMALDDSVAGNGEMENPFAV